MKRSLLQLAYALSFLVFPLFVMLLAAQRLANIPLRLAFFSVLVIAGAWLLMHLWPAARWGTTIALTALGYGVAYKIAAFIPDISSYPFSLSWSEASRYYNASLWLSKSIYGISTPPSVLHPSRYLLQALPFLFPNAPLLIHRLWQVVLWLVMTSLTSYLLVKRLSLAGNKLSLAISLGVFAWAFLFLFQGPVYYHLLLMVILLLWGFRSTRFWLSLVIVVLASLWAGISRVNWLPVPGFLAAALYLIEIPAQGKRFWRYLAPPILWVLAGTGVAYASQLAYQNLSGNPVAWFGSSFSSDLLWYRLFPNLTFPLGILLSSILVSTPLLGLVTLHLYKHWREYQVIRILGLAAILLVLFAGGVIVSLKIGGGSNLHNLDAYLTLLLVTGSYIVFNRFQPDIPIQENVTNREITPTAVQKPHTAIEMVFITATIAFPLYFTLSVGGQPPKLDFSAAQAALQSIRSATEQVASLGGEVLFINQRQLLTFGYIQSVPLVPEDELVFLMEMAMSDNSSYLDAFQADISHQRYGMIVSEPLTIQLQGKSHSFGEENDAWVEQVSEPILCYYQPTTTLDSVGVVLYTPRTAPCKQLGQ